MSLPPRIGRVIAATFVMCLLVAGCQSNPEPAPLPSPTPSPTPSSSPSPTVAAPTLPPEARGTSTASAKAFVRHWISALNYAGPSGETAQLMRLNASDCAACTAIADLIREASSAGGFIKGAGWEVKNVRIVYSDKSQVVVDALVNVHPQRIKTDASAPVRRFEGGPRLKTFWLVRAANSWRVARLDQPQ